jgi:hypothetical protein
MDEEKLIPDLINHLAQQPLGSKEYDSALKQLRELVHIQKELNDKPPSKVKQLLENSALIGVLGNFAIALLMLNYEKTDIITSSVRSMIRSK